MTLRSIVGQKRTLENKTVKEFSSGVQVSENNNKKPKKVSVNL